MSIEFSQHSVDVETSREDPRCIVEQDPVSDFLVQHGSRTTRVRSSVFEVPCLGLMSSCKYRRRTFTDAVQVSVKAPDFI